MVTICLLRHGETAFNADGNRYCGRTDVELTEKGLIQARRMHDLLSGFEFDAIYSSTLKRARVTAGIASGLPDQVVTDERLIEIDFGNWEGKCSEKFMEENPRAWQDWLSDPYHSKAGRVGESGEEVLERLHDFYQEIVQKHKGQHVLIVGHNGINRFFLSDALGMPLKNYRRIVQENSSLTLLNLFEDGTIQLLKLNA